MKANEFQIKANGNVEASISLEKVIEGLADGNYDLQVDALLDGVVQASSPVVNFDKVNAFDPDYQAVLDYMTAEGITLPDSAQQQVHNDIMVGLKSTGRWDKSDAVLVLSGTGSVASKLVDWKRLIQVDAFGSLTWNNTGVRGNGSNAYIDPLFIPLNGVNYQLNDASVITKATYVSPASEEPGSIFGVDDGTSKASYLRLISRIYTRLNDNYTFIQPDDTSSGLISVTRSAADKFKIINEAGEKTITANSVARPTEKMTFLNYKENGTNKYFSKDEISCILIGSSVSTSEHNELKSIL